MMQSSAKTAKFLCSLRKPLRPLREIILKKYENQIHHC
jgi:hypothetical protein